MMRRVSHSISEPKLPKGDDVTVACLNVILHDIALLCCLYLLLLFLLATHLKGIFLCNEEVRNRRGRTQGFYLCIVKAKSIGFLNM